MPTPARRSPSKATDTLDIEGYAQESIGHPEASHSPEAGFPTAATARRARRAGPASVYAAGNHPRVGEHKIMIRIGLQCSTRYFTHSTMIDDLHEPSLFFSTKFSAVYSHANRTRER